MYAQLLLLLHKRTRPLDVRLLLPVPFRVASGKGRAERPQRVKTRAIQSAKELVLEGPVAL